MLAEIPVYPEFQERAAEATGGNGATTILELGIGTGETTRRVLARHLRARGGRADPDRLGDGPARPARRSARMATRGRLRGRGRLDVQGSRGDPGGALGARRHEHEIGREP